MDPQHHLEVSSDELCLHAITREAQKEIPRAH